MIKKQSSGVGSWPWRENFSEFFLKFYLNLSAFWPCFQRYGRLIQRNSENKANEFRMIQKKRWVFFKFLWFLVHRVWKLLYVFWIFRPNGLNIFFWIILSSFAVFRNFFQSLCHLSENTAQMRTNSDKISKKIRRSFPARIIRVMIC